MVTQTRNEPVNPQPRPRGTVVMFQNWRRLLFLHWSWDAAEVQATLPPDLEVDTWNGRAWLGIVPFKMEGVRPRFCPALPGISDFPELNVRTYVRDQYGRAGVWFYSLDCAQPLAVWTARATFGLPYFHARMREDVAGVVTYDCRRLGVRETAHFEYAGVESIGPSKEGTIEQFLIERYRLFALRGGRIFTGQVWHEPYALQRVESLRWSDVPLRQAGFDPVGHPPEHAVFAPGVDVKIIGIERV